MPLRNPSRDKQPGERDKKIVSGNGTRNNPYKVS